MRRPWGVLIGVPLLLPVVAPAQAVVEHATITGTTGTAAAGAKGAGRSVGGIFQNLNRTLAGQSSPSSKVTVTRVRSTGVARATGSDETSAPIFQPVDPAQVQPGLSRQELLSKFGEPMMKYANRRQGREGQVYLYSSADSGAVEIFLYQGKVFSVSSDQEDKKKGSGVLLLP